MTFEVPRQGRTSRRRWGVVFRRRFGGLKCVRRSPWDRTVLLKSRIEFISVNAERPLSTEFYRDLGQGTG